MWRLQRGPCIAEAATILEAATTELRNRRARTSTISSPLIPQSIYEDSKIFSMTQVLSHTVAHFTGPSFMLKVNNQPSSVQCTQDLKIFIEQVIVLEHKRRPCKMCDSVRQKLGHTNMYVITLFIILF